MQTIKLIPSLRKLLYYPYLYNYLRRIMFRLNFTVEIFAYLGLGIRCDTMALFIKLMQAMEKVKFYFEY